MVPKYWELRYGRLDTLNIKIRPLIEENKCNNSGTEERRNTVDTMSVLISLTKKYSAVQYYIIYD